ncbi:hypothetical protein HDU92_008476 [Lobulomyces angularis]|nr:hypothetical protein HDU92_008476 [Lobulomyces angularis]
MVLHRGWKKGKRNEKSNPDGYDINFRCVDQSTVTSHKVTFFCGKDDWEKSFDASNIKDKSIE